MRRRLAMWSLGALFAGAAAARAQTEPDEPPEDTGLEDIPVEAGTPGDAGLEDMPVEAEAPRPAGPRDAVEWFGDFEVELRLFARDALGPAQPDHASTAAAYRPGVVVEPRRWMRLRAVGFLRVDEHDPERSIVDLRQAICQLPRGDWTFTLGVHKVFWGVTESRHLVDIVNQIDYAEDLDGEERLGQLMAMASYETSAIGLLDAFVMSWHRAQRYPGITGRPGLPLPVAGDEALYESSLERWNVDLALRWSRSRGALDWALSYFYGTARDPQLRPALIGGEMVLQPDYDLIHQGGLELQWTGGAWLAKLEAIVRAGQGPTFAAVTGGVERTISGVAGDADLTLFAEYNYDGRDTQTFTFYENHAFAAARLSLNDASSTEATLGALVDVDSGDTFGSLELTRRLGGGWKATVEARVFAADDEQDVLYFFRRDHYLEAALAYYY